MAWGYLITYLEYINIKPIFTTNLLIYCNPHKNIVLETTFPSFACHKNLHTLFYSTKIIMVIQNSIYQYHQSHHSMHLMIDMALHFERFSDK